MDHEPPPRWGDVFHPKEREGIRKVHDSSGSRLFHFPREGEAPAEPLHFPQMTLRSAGASPRGEGEKGSSLNSAFLTPKPPASSVYVRVLEATPPLKRSILVVSPFP